MNKLISYIKLKLLKRRLKKKYNIELKQITTTKTKRELVSGQADDGPLCYEVGIDKHEAIKRMKERRAVAGMVGEAMKNYGTK